MPNYIMPKVDLPKVGRGNHDLSKSVMLSFAPGTARVLWAKDVLPKDHIEIDLTAGIESFPMLSPMYGRWKARWAFYFEPYTNIYGWMDNDTRRSTEAIMKSDLITYTLPLQVETPNSFPAEYSGAGSVVRNWRDVTASGAITRNGVYTVSLSEYQHLAGVSEGSIFEDLGWPLGWKGYSASAGRYAEKITESLAFVPAGLSSSTIDRLNEFGATESTGGLSSSVYVCNEQLHAVKALAYLDVIRNYYVNNQALLVPYVSRSTEVGEVDAIKTVSLETLDYIFMAVRAIPPELYAGQNIMLSQLVGMYHTPYFGEPSSGTIADSKRAVAVSFLEDWERSYAVPNGGCFLVPHNMDLNRGLMNLENGNFQQYVEVKDGRISVTELYTANALQSVVNVLDVTRGRFSDWVNALFAVDLKGDIDRPVYLGSHTEYIATTDIISPSTTEGSKAGQQTGFVAGGMRKKKRITLNSDQYGVVMCVFTFTPDVMYSQGFKREDLKSTFAGIYNPRMANIGYQMVPNTVLNAFSPTVHLEHTLQQYDLTEFGAKAYSSTTPVLPVEYETIPSYDVSQYSATADIRRLYQQREEPFKWPAHWVDNVPTYAAVKNVVAVGRQVAWAEYMSDIDESRGFFAKAGSLDYWVLNRSFSVSDVGLIRVKTVVKTSVAGRFTYVFNAVRQVVDVADYSTYVRPSDYNKLFADTNDYAQNFRMFANFRVFAKRTVPTNAQLAHFR